MNPLSSYPQARKIAYYVSFVLGLALGAAQVAYGSANVETPTWLTVSLAVFAFLAAGLGITAGQNTDATPERTLHEPNRVSDTDVEGE